jgi:hypothetical protein
VEDKRGVNDGHRRSAAVSPNLAHDQRKRDDQQHLSRRLLDGMQDVREQGAHRDRVAQRPLRRAGSWGQTVRTSSTACSSPACGRPPQAAALGGPPKPQMGGVGGLKRFAE